MTRQEELIIELYKLNILDQRKYIMYGIEKWRNDVSDLINRLYQVTFIGGETTNV